jgi:hypothetical protein
MSFLTAGGRSWLGERNELRPYNTVPVGAQFIAPTSIEPAALLFAGGEVS